MNTQQPSSSPSSTGSAQTGTGVKPAVPEVKPAPHQPEQIRSTRLFKFLNPELFIKPNKWVMAGGIIAFASAIGFLAYSENQHREELKRAPFDPAAAAILEAKREEVERDGTENKRALETYAERMERLKAEQRSRGY